MAGWNAITGARGIVAAFLMSALLQVGLVDVTTGLLLCGVSTGIGVVLYARAGMAPAAVAPVQVAAPRRPRRRLSRGGTARPPAPERLGPDVADGEPVGERVGRVDDVAARTR